MRSTGIAAWTDDAGLTGNHFLTVQEIDILIVEARGSSARAATFDGHQPIQRPTDTEPTLIGAAQLESAGGIVGKSQVRFDAAKGRNRNRIVEDEIAVGRAIFEAQGRRLAAIDRTFFRRYCSRSGRKRSLFQGQAFRRGCISLCVGIGFSGNRLG